MFGFGKNAKKKRLMDAARISVELIIEGSGMPESDSFWQDSYTAGFLYARSIEGVVYENGDKLDELCKDAWLEFWQSEYPVIASYIMHFSALETDPDYDNELEVNQNIIEEFSKGQKVGRLSLMVNIGRARTIDEGFTLAQKQAEEAIKSGEAEAPTQRDFNHVVDIFFVKNNLFDRVNEKRNKRLEELEEEYGSKSERKPSKAEEYLADISSEYCKYLETFYKNFRIFPNSELLSDYHMKCILAIQLYGALDHVVAEKFDDAKQVKFFKILEFEKCLQFDPFQWNGMEITLISEAILDISSEPEAQKIIDSGKKSVDKIIAMKDKDKSYEEVPIKISNFPSAYILLNKELMEDYVVVRFKPIPEYSELVDSGYYDV